MSEIIAGPPVLPCYSPVSGSAIAEYQWLVPDPFASRARARERILRGPLARERRPESSRPGMRASLFVAEMSLFAGCYLAVIAAVMALLNTREMADFHAFPGA
jgi:hypothetical protein